ncbi:MAG TPA: alanyl-tRNA editing protein [Alphaproteobacteria bacterium]|nr:alanyl-tRNA editing protein [Alphaproteobacteria bacterium]HQS93326.1 alanyl-tRNA editing protein [Alphaproteobacteria bacterium]
MSSDFSYFEDPKFSEKVTIEALKKDEKGYFVLLDQTFFYPQGGGQPSDQGQLILDDREIPIVSVRMVDGEVRHYTDQDYGNLSGQQATCIIDAEKRSLHSKLHTSGHLISNIVEELYPVYKALKGHHFPGECYVEFIAKNGFSDPIDLDFVSQKISEVISENKAIQTKMIASEDLPKLVPTFPYCVPAHSSIRIVSIGDFSYQPCGGTHVKTTSELQGLTITKVKIKNKTLKINYTLA